MQHTTQYWNSNLSKLVQHCSEQGIGLTFAPGKDDVYDTDEKTIVINSRRTKENQFYILLHELGHHKIFLDKKLAEKFQPVNTDVYPQTLTKQILLLEEEITAWNLGEEFALSLGIELPKKFYILRARCLKTHIRWHTKI